MNDLLQELTLAHRIIEVMLNNMTLAEKMKASRVLSGEGVINDGLTRYHERRAVIERYSLRNSQGEK